MFSVLSQINKRQEYMTPVEQRIANFILENPRKIINMPVKDIAFNSNTSDAAIVRFAKRVGLAGIKELKVELAKELHTLEKEKISRVIDLEADNHRDIFDKVFKNTIQALYNTEKIVSRDVMEEAAHLILKADNTFIFGVGDSANVGHDIEQKLHRVNVNAFFTADKYLCLTRLSNARENDVLFVITLSGKTAEVIEVVKKAKALGIKIVILTQNHASIAKRHSDLAIEITEEETNIQYMNMTSRIAQLVICDVLFFYVCRELGSSAYDTIMKTYDATH
ncbi:MurR/RpiR family transcriptional regulator [Salinicoccus halitifaciens]|uniref:DNA-binding MurR/RpiR family transcriptional regulator n=1 Tax=Salinicoccus halitifaciens TaxID=1073415 RepID=A0ABV2EC58_9STAP|nr:MurR/RpiR family transcriptional regulator [Salinicoccus halitifaciens]MCD2137328.1 MurR/RpiR family transcriptional regulator [Salinicoccus halitifaciens]